MCLKIDQEEKQENGEEIEDYEGDEMLYLDNFDDPFKG